jgi:hypothetical protein
VVVTDASGDELPDAGVEAPVLVELVGASDDNQSIAALSVLRRAGGAQLDLFAAVANPSASEATRRLEVYADGTLVDARDLAIPPGQRSEVLIGTVPAVSLTVEARLAGSDALAADDRAFAIVPAEESIRALLVGDGNPYLENALALLPRLELFAVGEAGYADALAEGDESGTPYGLLVFDGVVPEEEPEVAALYVDPPEDGPYGTVSGRIDRPVIDRPDPDEPLLRFVDLTTVHVGRAREIEVADGMRAIVETPRQAPLIGVGEEGGTRLAFIGFDLAESDLPLQVAFPLLLSNLVDFLASTEEGILPSSMRLGQSLALRVDDQLQRVRLTVLPADADGYDVELPVTDGRVTLPGADAVGLRSLVALGTEEDPATVELGRTAVNLFSPDESDVAPGDPQRIVDMGRVPADVGPPPQPARTEWWWPLVLGALVLLAIEWLLFHRPNRQRLTRAIGRRPQPLGGRPR